MRNRSRSFSDMEDSSWSLRRRFSRCESFLFALLFLTTLWRSHAERFHGDSSTSFIEEESTFRLDYLDGSYLKGRVASDVVQLGNYFARMRFGAVRDKEGVWDADGIIGFGLPQATDPHMPIPMLYSLSSSGMSNKAPTNELTENMFALSLNETGGQLQLGGYILPETASSMKFFNAMPLKHKLGKPQFLAYALPIDRIRLDHQEILVVRSDRSRQPGILDSGTSCLILPSSRSPSSGFSGASPWERFLDAVDAYASAAELIKAAPPFYITILGIEYRIPFEHFATVRAGSNMVDFCVYKLDVVDEILILGAPFYRSLFVVHDNSNSDQPRIGLAQRVSEAEMSAAEPVASSTESGLRSSEEESEQLILSDGVIALPEYRSDTSPGLILDLATEAVETTSPRVRLRQDVASLFTSSDHPLTPAELDRSGSPAEHAEMQFGVRRVAARSNDQGSFSTHNVELHSTTDRVYTVAISVGSPRQVGIRVIVDTGSSTLAVFLHETSVLSWLTITVIVVAVILAAVFCINIAMFRKRLDFHRLMHLSSITVTSTSP